MTNPSAEEDEDVVGDEGASPGDAVEATGKTVQEATDNALVDLGLEEDEVEVEVLNEGRAGLFGIGGEPARVRVVPLPEDETADFEEPEGDDVAFAQETLETILDLMGVEATVSTRPPETPGDGLGLAKAVLDVEGDDLGILIGRRGTALYSLQYLVNLIVTHHYNQNAPFTIDIEGYRRRREESLRSLAFRMAERVRETGRSITLEPMPANERRIVHLALAKDPTVGTSSVGEGDTRKVAISVRR